MSKLILHLGPTRTGTTYIWRLIVENNLLDKVKLNIPSEQIRLLHYLRSELDENNVSLIQFEGAIKEDQTLIELINECNSKHPSEKTLDVDRWNKFFYWWFHKIDNISNKSAIGNQLNIITPYATSNLLDNFKELEKQLYQQNFRNDTLTWGLPSDYKNFTNNPAPQLLILPNLVLCELGWQHVNKGVGGFQSGSLGRGQTDVSRYNGVVTVDDMIKWIPYRQTLLLDVINQLSLHYDQVVLCTVLRDPVERIQSWVSIKQSFVQHESRLADTIHGIADSSCNSDNVDVMHNWMNNIMTTYFDYPVLSSLFTNKLPDNVTVRVMQYTDLNSAEQLNRFMPEIFSQDCDQLKGFNRPVFKSYYPKTAELNTRLIELNYEHLELIKNNINNTAA